MEKKTREFVENWVLDDLRKKGATFSDGWLVLVSGSLGIRELAKVDFLVNHKNYNVMFVKK